MDAHKYFLLTSAVTLWLIACGSPDDNSSSTEGAAPPRIDFTVTTTQCKCAITSYLFQLIRQDPDPTCQLQLVEKSATPEITLDEVNVTTGDELVIYLYAYCGNTSCVNCFSMTRLSVHDNASDDILLVPSQDCFPVKSNVSSCLKEGDH